MVVVLLMVAKDVWLEYQSALLNFKKKRQVIQHIKQIPAR
jgi:hypothetical protein